MYNITPGSLQLESQ